MSFDHAAWLSGAQRFVSELQDCARSFAEVRCEIEVGPPASPAEVQRVIEAWSDLDLSVLETVEDLDTLVEPEERRLPAELVRFYTQASRGCRCEFICEAPEAEAEALLDAALDGEAAVYGGPAFFDISELPDRIRSCYEWATETWIAEDEAARQYWLSAVPFVHLKNGDYLGLDISEGGDDPPVVYLSHDDESFALAQSFTAFLTAWEQLCYVGPEAWLLGQFIGEEGVLDPGTGKASRLRQLLGVEA